MRLYYYTPETHALENLCMRHLKLSFPDEVNDVFELKPFSFQGKNSEEKRKLRAEWRDSIVSLSKSCGFISFSSNWHSPTMWAHYANNHLGLCYGFEIDESGLDRVGYVEHLQKIHRADLKCTQRLKNLTGYAKCTKSLHWAYEQEWRMYVKLEPADVHNKAKGQRLFFTDFSKKLRLKEVIIGCESKISSQQIKKALSDYEDVVVKTARPAFESFKIVEQQSSNFQK